MKRLIPSSKFQVPSSKFQFFAALCVLCASAFIGRAGTFDCQWLFRDAGSNVLAIKQVTLQPIAPYGVDASSVLITGDRKTYQSDSAGSLIASNLFNGRSYRVQITGPNFNTTFTNSFDTNVTGLVNGADPAYLGLPIRDAATVAYSQAVADGRFLRTNISNFIRPGSNVTISTNGTGPSQYLTISSSGGGGSSLWDSDSGTIFPNGDSGSDSAWTSDGDSIYPQ